MGMKNKFKNFFYLDEEDDTLEVESSSKPVHVQKDPPPIRTKKEKRIFEDDTNHFSKQTKNVVSLQAANSLKNSKVVIVEPRVYAEAQDISEHLKNKRTIILNLQRIEREAGIRIIDFLSGTVYALGGDIQRIGTDIFLCTPDNIEVSGEISTFSLDEF